MNKTNNTTNEEENKNKVFSKLYYILLILFTIIITILPKYSQLLQILPTEKQTEYSLALSLFFIIHLLISNVTEEKNLQEFSLIKLILYFILVMFSLKLPQKVLQFYGKFKKN